MKYLNYIVRGDFNIDSIVSKNKILRPPTILLGIAVSVFGVVLLSGALPLAGMADGVRYAKIKRYAYLKLRTRQRYINRVCKSLSTTKQEQNRINKLINELV